MREYHFLTLWKLAAPREAVCKLIEDSLAWPEWWHGVEKVEQLSSGDAYGIGSVRRYTWKGRLPYTLTFDVCVTAMQPLAMVEGAATGDVEGLGRWSFSTEGPYTWVRYEWHVRPMLWWVRLMHPLIRPLLRWNHDALMRQGGEGLARKLRVPLAEIHQH